MKKREKKANNRPGRGENGNFLGAAESRTLPGSSAPSRSRTFRSRPFPAPAALPRLYPDGIHMEFPASGGSEPPLLGLFQLFPLFPLNCSRLFGVLGVLFFVSSPLSQPNLIYFGADPVFPGASRSEPPPLPFGFLGSPLPLPFFNLIYDFLSFISSFYHFIFKVIIVGGVFLERPEEIPVGKTLEGREKPRQERPNPPGSRNGSSC